MPCPVKELGAISPLDMVAGLVAQAIVPVPQFDCGFVRAKQGNRRTRCLILLVWRDLYHELVVAQAETCATETRSRAERVVVRQH